MSCNKPKCRHKSDDALVMCWICDATFHAKCVELSPGTAVNLCEDKGLKWCCKKCKVFNPEFYSFLKNTRKELHDLHDNLKSFMAKFSKYVELFDKAPSSPRTKNKKTSATGSQHSTVLSVATSISSNSVEPIPSYDTTDPSTQDPPLTALPILSNNIINTPSLTLNSDPISPVSSENTGELIMKAGHSQTSSIASYSNRSTINKNPNEPFQLKVVSPKKTIFAARFAAETTTEDVKRYIIHKLGHEIEMSVFKFQYTEKRSKSSFKIIVPEENFDVIVNANFWPPKAIIQEFEYRNMARSDTVYLPKN